MSKHKKDFALGDEDITVKIWYSIRDLQRLDTVSHKGGWDRLPQETKEGLLWSLGFDVYKYGYYEQLCNHRTRAENAVVTDRMIYSQERTDADWVNMIVAGKRVASLDAQLAAKGDSSLDRELSRMSRTASDF